MTDEELIGRLRAFANGCRGSMWQSRDKTISLMDAAASTITRLLAVLDEDALEEAISDSLDMDWQPRYAARLIRQRAGLEGDVP